MWSMSVAWKSKIFDLIIFPRVLPSDSAKEGHEACLYIVAEKKDTISPRVLGASKH